MNKEKKMDNLIKFEVFIRSLAVFGILAFWSILGLVIILLALPISWNKYLCYPLGKALKYVGDQIDELYY